MDEIFANAKNILAVWIEDTQPENLSIFQEVLQTKAKQAQVVYESVKMLLECKCHLIEECSLKFDFFALYIFE